MSSIVRRSTTLDRRARFDGTEHGAWSRRKGRPEQHPIDDRVFVALLEPRATSRSWRSIQPGRPFHLRRAQGVEARVEDCPRARSESAGLR